MNSVAGCFLIPVGVVAFTMFGGIKATFLTDWANAAMVNIIILIFAFVAFAKGAELGSPRAVYDLLVEAGNRHPVDGNQDGSYLTMSSREGGIFFVINVSLCLSRLLCQFIANVHSLWESASLRLDTPSPVHC